jgi:Icc protein
MSAALRIALVTDIHHGADTGTKVGSQALPLLRRFCDRAEDLAVDLVVEMGDRINDVNRDTDMAHTREVAAAFANLSVPRVHLLGNHETAKMTPADAETALGQSLASHSRDLGDFHLVFWNADVRVQLGPRFVISEDDLAWLAADLAATERPTMLFSHIPLDDSSMTGNFYFERVAHGLGHYSNGAAAREVIERSGKVFLCLAGHVHWNRHTAVDGVHHIAIQSLTESFTCHPQAAGAYALLEVGDDIRLEVFGHDPFAVRLPAKPLGYHWMNLHRDYAPAPAWLSPSMQKALAER